ncbi:uncharacterized protein LOC131158472 [Malania oleifera]|uniref:uncharacterized protein LOC131158472 n=1 Tax=Malania oleifera TaxID=397392 RepID=UPI0025AEA126|nr:uncharacterized protein LOC131158472 [Malania oleifera]
MSVTEYMSKFDELSIRCGIEESMSQQISRFRIGLKPKLRKELFPHHIDSLEHAFKLAHDCEQMSKTHLSRKFGTPSNDTNQRKATSYVRTRPTNTGQVTSRGSNPTVQQPVDKGKAPMNGSSKQVSGSDVCYKCHKRGHLSKQCATRNLAIEREEEEDQEKDILTFLKK